MRTDKQNQRIRDEKTARIINAAMSLFEQKGYHGSSMSMIAKEAGVSKALLYHYFESKEALIRAIYVLSSDILNKAISLDINGIMSPNEFDTYVRRSFEVVKEHLDLYRFMFSTIYIPDVFAMVKQEKQGYDIQDSNLLWAYFNTRFDDPAREMALYGMMMRGLITSYCISNGQLSDELADDMLQKIIDMFNK